jgi:hypothetical protein
MGLEGRIVEAGLFFLEKPGPMAIPAITGDPTKVECRLSLISLPLKTRYCNTVILTGATTIIVPIRTNSPNAGESLR